MREWLPGHARRAPQLLERYGELLGAVVEVADARAPAATRYPGLSKLVRKGRHVLVLTCGDLANSNATDRWKAYFAGMGVVACPVELPRGQGMAKLRAALRPEGDKPMRVAVVGVPNVGKSTLLNALVGRHKAPTGDRPGITRGGSWIRAGMLEVLDTPGLLWPRAAKLPLLSMLGMVEPDPDQVENLAQELLQLLPSLFSGDLESFGAARGLFREGGRVDSHRAARTLLREFQRGRLGRWSLEEPAE